MDTQLQLIASREFNGVILNCYQEKGQNNPADFWATREQIGLLLEYENPSDAIRFIHNRNKERLDKFSTTFKLNHVEGERVVTREVIMYSFRGLLEICRYSQQPKANAVMDFLYDIADEIRRTGEYRSKDTHALSTTDAVSAARIVFESAGITGNQAALALDRVYRSYTGRSAIEIGGITLTAQTLTLTAPTQRQLLTPTDIGKHFGLKAQRVNEILADNGYQHKIFGNWEPLKLGEKFAVMLDVGKIY